MLEVIVGGTYRHYKKGTDYEVIGIARHSETLEELVIHTALYDSPDFSYQISSSLLQSFPNTSV